MVYNYDGVWESQAMVAREQGLPPHDAAARDVPT